MSNCFFLPLRSLTRISLALITAVAISLPVRASQRLIFIYPPINRSLGIDSLETFANTGTVSRELADYFRLAGVGAEQKEEFRKALLETIPVNPVQLSRFFNTPTGETLLEQVGALVSIQGGRNGKFALRGALVQAAFDRKNGSLTLLNFLKHLPTNVQLNLPEIITAGSLVELLIGATQEITREMAVISKRTAQKENVDFSRLPDPRQVGTFGIAPPETWLLTDSTRNHSFRTIVYRPKQWRKGKTPVVVMSHGLASRPEDFSQRAEHLASHGFVVVLPQHAGSDIEQVQAMLNGFSRELFKLDEFIDRPKDVSFVLDELERRNASEFGDRLDLENVVAVGHSFGGYTVFALGGATIDFENLQSVCDRTIWGPNISLLLQCLALKLPRKDYNFRDKRVQSIIAINPVNSAIFGERGISQIEVPTLIGAGSNDPATPAASEQLRTFVWLTAPEKYLILIEGQAHVNFTQLDANTQALIKSLPNVTLPQQSLIDRYADSLLLAFAEVYGAKNEEYRPFLTSSFAQYISRDPHPVFFAEASAQIPLSQLFNRLRPAILPPLVPQAREIGANN